MTDQSHTTDAPEAIATDQPPPTSADLLLRWPLYRRMDLSDSDRIWVQRLRCLNFQIDAPCFHCGKEATFYTADRKNNYEVDPLINGIFHVWLTCVRDENHT